MLFGKKDQEESKYLDPIFGNPNEDADLPKYKLAGKSMQADVAYRMVKDELEDEGNARQNLATFCQTYMEPEATQLMAETLEKNAIDKSEYPRTTEIENRCVNILADLWHAPKDGNYLGTSTVGSSEACMLGGLAMKFAWRKRAEKLGLDLNAHKPNLVISSSYQVCWEKFCTYWDIELREVPLDENDLSLNMDTVMDYVDEYTIGIVGIMGITYTGRYDNIKKLNDLVEEYNKHTDYKVYIHVDAASGGFYTPFVEPEIEWDFKLKNVVSINSSGHKYGLVYPGIGWVLWRDAKFVPQDLIFNVSYLGGEMPTMAINFSRSASQIIGQYYNFVRYGFDGYREIHQRTHEVAKYIIKEIKKTGRFKVVNGAQHLPILCYALKDDHAQEWNLYDLSDRLRMRGWQVPTYPMPDNLNNLIVQRIVCRADLGMNVAIEFIEDFKACLEELDHAHVLAHHSDEQKKTTYGFTH